MTSELNIALGQLNYTVGDLTGNRLKIEQAHMEAAEQGADLLVLSELALVGYPPEDLIFRKEFQQHAMQSVLELARLTQGESPAILVGGVWYEDEQVYNAAFLLDEGEIHSIITKFSLPNYGVFDEQRIFMAGSMPEPVQWRGVNLGILVCRDLWDPEIGKQMALKNAEMMLVLNASPYDVPKWNERIHVSEVGVQQAKAPLIYVNQVGGQDELVFDGRSFIMDREGTLDVEMPAWEEGVQVTQWQKEDEHWHCTTALAQPEVVQEEEIYNALVVGVHDYVQKNGFPGVLIGMSGGIDSALTAAIATDALGASHVNTVMMPFTYTSEESQEDAKACAKALGVPYEVIPIAPAYEGMELMLAPSFHGAKPDITEENIQSRLRGLTLMAMSNKFRHMLLTTGNKSEMAVGYATLYGDMCGGYNPLKDVYKTQVFALARWRNQHRPKGGLGPEHDVIPERIITKPPSAELRPDQKDEDSLPAYEVLDKLLREFVENERSVEEIAESLGKKVDRNLVEKVARLLYLSEYKRRQAPPGVKISRMSFGRDRRYPLTNRYRSGA